MPLRTCVHLLVLLVAGCVSAPSLLGESRPLQTIDLDGDGSKDLDVRQEVTVETSRTARDAPGENSTTTVVWRLIPREGATVWIDAGSQLPWRPPNSPVPPEPPGTWIGEPVEIARAIGRTEWQFVPATPAGPWIWKEQTTFSVPLAVPSTGGLVAVRLDGGSGGRLGWAELLPSMEWIGGSLFPDGGGGTIGYRGEPWLTRPTHTYGPRAGPEPGPRWFFGPIDLDSTHLARSSDGHAQVSFSPDGIARATSPWIAEVQLTEHRIHFQSLPGYPISAPAPLGPRTYLAVRVGQTQDLLISRVPGSPETQVEFTLPQPLPAAPALGPVWPGRDGHIYGAIHPGWKVNRLFRWAPGSVEPEILGELPEIPLQGIVTHRTGSDGGHYAVGRLPTAGVRSGLLRLPPLGGAHEVMDAWTGEGLPLVEEAGDALTYLRVRTGVETGLVEELVRHRPQDGVTLVWQSPANPQVRIVALAGAADGRLWSIRADGTTASPHRHLAWFNDETRAWVPVGRERLRNYTTLTVVGDNAIAVVSEDGSSTLWVADTAGRLRFMPRPEINPMGGLPAQDLTPIPDGWLAGTTTPADAASVGRFFAIHPERGWRIAPAPDEYGEFGQVPSANVTPDPTGRLVGAVWDRRSGTAQIISFEPDGTALRREHTLPIPLPQSGLPRLQVLAAEASRIWLVAEQAVGDRWNRVITVDRGGEGGRVIWGQDPPAASEAGFVRLPGRGVLVLVNDPGTGPDTGQLRAEWIPDDGTPVAGRVLMRPDGTGSAGTFSGGRMNARPIRTPEGRVFVGMEAWRATDGHGVPFPDGTHLGEIMLDPATGEFVLRPRVGTRRIRSLASRSAASLVSVGGDGALQILYPDQGLALDWRPADPTVRSASALGSDLVVDALYRPDRSALTIHAGPVEGPVAVVRPLRDREAIALTSTRVDIGTAFAVPERAPPPRYTVTGLPPGLTMSPSGVVEGILRRDGAYAVEIVAEALGDPSWRATNRFQWVVAKQPVRIVAASDTRVVGQVSGFTPKITQVGGPPLTVGYRLLADDTSPPGLYPIVPFVIGTAETLEGLDIEIVRGVLRLQAEGLQWEAIRSEDGRNSLWVRSASTSPRRIRVEFSVGDLNGPWQLLAERVTDGSTPPFELLLPRPVNTDARFFRIQSMEP